MCVCVCVYRIADGKVIMLNLLFQSLRIEFVVVLEMCWKEVKTVCFK